MTHEPPKDIPGRDRDVTINLSTDREFTQDDRRKIADHVREASRTLVYATSGFSDLDAAAVYDLMPDLRLTLAQLTNVIGNYRVAVEREAPRKGHAAVMLQMAASLLTLAHNDLTDAHSALA